jgi:hypothetical protein
VAGVSQIVELFGSAAVAHIYGVATEEMSSGDEVAETRRMLDEMRERTGWDERAVKPTLLRTYTVALNMNATLDDRMYYYLGVKRPDNADDKGARVTQFNELLRTVVAREREARRQGADETVYGAIAKGVFEAKVCFLVYVLNYQSVVAQIHAHEYALLRMLLAYIPIARTRSFQTYDGHPHFNGSMSGEIDALHPSMMLRNLMLAEEVGGERVGKRRSGALDDECNLFGRRYAFGAPIVTNDLAVQLREGYRNLIRVRGKMYGCDISDDSAREACIADMEMYSTVAPLHGQPESVVSDRHVFGDASPTYKQMCSYMHFLECRHRRYKPFRSNVLTTSDAKLADEGYKLSKRIAKDMRALLAIVKEDMDESSRLFERPADGDDAAAAADGDGAVDATPDAGVGAGAEEVLVC